jgi:hypothetical protein
MWQFAPVKRGRRCTPLLVFHQLSMLLAGPKGTERKAQEISIKWALLRFPAD